MANSPSTLNGIGVRSGWAEVLVRTLQMALVAFVILNLKEWLETGEWDLPACAIDAAWVAGGAFVFNAIFVARLAGESSLGRPGPAS